MWYSAALFFQGVSQTHRAVETLWEEKLLLIDADSAEKAQSIAEQIGRASEHAYTSATQEDICWTFVCVERVYEIMDVGIKNGTELFSRFLRDSEARSLMTPFDD
jgi:Domain of unknown function (DUF4288)